ncbi:putative undecaprenyl-diphosphatase YbjG [bacterium BMS3Abin01]|nr:putative undecaprenyl-diphosphatase YbjG [bacterium BMS3Abin01]HDY69682.1 phosphatase PAP2 family protein [Actinomycetota bacterium]
MPEQNGSLSSAPGGEGAEDEESLDYTMFVALRTRGHPRWLEKIVIIFSQSGSWGLFWLGLALVLWLAGVSFGRGVFFFLIPVIYTTLIVNYIIKSIGKRERPVSDDPRLQPLVGVPSSKSFPSSHAAMSFAAAVAMTFYYAPLWAMFFGLAFLMSWSRVYVGVHYPSDVIAGTFVGLLMGTFNVIMVIFV